VGGAVGGARVLSALADGAKWIWNVVRSEFGKVCMVRNTRATVNFSSEYAGVKEAGGKDGLPLASPSLLHTTLLDCVIASL
jgi:hypothetical protein